jgi:hypothetical protein
MFYSRLYDVRDSNIALTEWTLIFLHCLYCLPFLYVYMFIRHPLNAWLHVVAWRSFRQQPSFLNFQILSILLTATGHHLLTAKLTRI